MKENKEIQRWWLSNNCGVFVLNFIEYTIMRRPISRIVKNNMEAYKKEIGPTLLEFCEGNGWHGALYDQVFIFGDPVIMYTFSSMYICYFTIQFNYSTNSLINTTYKILEMDKDRFYPLVKAKCLNSFSCGFIARKDVAESILGRSYDGYFLKIWTICDGLLVNRTGTNFGGGSGFLPLNFLGF